MTIFSSWHCTVFFAGFAGLVACGTTAAGDEPNLTGISGAEAGQDSTGTTTNADSTQGAGAEGEATAATAPGPGESGDQTFFDLGDGSICESQPAGALCDGTIEVMCDGNSGLVSTTECLPGACIAGTGCVDCQEGEWTCKGPRVMACNTDAVPFWEEIEVCDAAGGMYCDVSVGGCSPLAPLGGTKPTGEYYQYSSFSPAVDGFNVVCDVDADGDRIWFVANNAQGQLSVGAYDVTLLDSDLDGELEPHQHPEDPEHTGPIEERVFTFVQSFPIDNGGAVPHQMELHATPTTLYWAGPQFITAYDLATNTPSVEAMAPPWLATQTYAYLAFLGHDDVNDVWYSGNETARRVFQYDAETETWGYAFEYPALAGDHMDGIEVVTDPNTGTAFVYVSDMTSNFIGQYRHDPQLGWVQENLFTYNEAAGEVVEGFGYGALRHFWVGSYTQNSFYEIGGGALTEFLDPPA